MHSFPFENSVGQKDNLLTKFFKKNMNFDYIATLLESPKCPFLNVLLIIALKYILIRSYMVLGKIIFFQDLEIFSYNLKRKGKI